MDTSNSRKQRGSFCEINITPLTDIFLVLLVIMMVIAPLLDQQGLKLSVPNYEQKTQKQKDHKIINIKVDDNDKYSIDGKSVAANDLINAVIKESKIKKDGLMIMAKDNATHGAVVKVMDIARNVGIANISVSEN